jgi:hypothetical protein
MGNWQLSVYYFTSKPAGMDPTVAMFVGIMTTIVSNAVMIVIFYLINKHYWEPHRRGEAAFGGRFLSLQTFVHDHDFERKPLVSTIAVFVMFIMMISGIIMSAAAIGGARPLWLFPPEAPSDSDETLNLDNFVEVVETETSTGMLTEGNSEIFTYTSEQDKYIKQVIVSITWTDEADRNIRYENQPDTFSVSISGLNYTQTASSANPTGGPGSISIQLSFSNENITEAIMTKGNNYTASVEITLVEAGNQEKRSGIPGLAWTDNQNQYDYQIWVVLLVPETE